MGLRASRYGRESTHLVLLALLRELVDEFRGKPVTHEVGRSVWNVTPTVRAFASGTGEGRPIRIRLPANHASG